MSELNRHTATPTVDVVSLSLVFEDIFNTLHLSQFVGRNLPLLAQHFKWSSTPYEDFPRSCRIFLSTSAVSVLLRRFTRPLDSKYLTASVPQGVGQVSSEWNAESKQMLPPIPCQNIKAFPIYGSVTIAACSHAQIFSAASGHCPQLFLSARVKKIDVPLRPFCL